MRQQLFNGLIAAITVVALVGFTSGVARADPSRTLTSIKTVSLAGGKVEVELTLSQAAPKPLSFSVNQPAMIVLDLPDTGIGLAQTRQTLDVGDLAGVQVAATRNRTRVVLNLNAMTPYRTRIEGRHVYITLGGETASVSQAGVSNATEQTFGPGSVSR